MAKRDVTLYFLQVQSQYFEMVKLAKELNEELKKGLITQEQLESVQNEMDILKANYERIAYIMLLLNKPNRKSKKSKEESIYKEWYDYLKGASKEAIMDENRDVLCDFKKFIKEIKDESTRNSK